MFGRGSIFTKLRGTEAQALGANAFRIDPQMPFLKGNLLHQKMLTCDWAEVDGLIRKSKATSLRKDWRLNRSAGRVLPSERSLAQCAELYNAKRLFRLARQANLVVIRARHEDQGRIPVRRVPPAGHFAAPGRRSEIAIPSN